MSIAAPLFRSSAVPGYSSALLRNPQHVFARKLISEVQVYFTPVDCTVQTNEGAVHAHAGDAIVTGGAGERWRVSKGHFAAKYAPVAPTAAGEDGRYTSLPNRILAVPMSEAFEVLLPDGVSRLRGRPTDWLVDYGDGSLGIVSASIFAATYQIGG